MKMYGYWQGYVFVGVSVHESEALEHLKWLGLDASELDYNSSGARR